MPTLQQYRRAAARVVSSEFGVFTTSSAGADLSHVVCSSFIDTNESDKAYDGAWLLFTTGTHAGQQRRVARGGFSTSDGILTTVRAYTGGTTTESGKEFEIHDRIPPATADGTMISLRDCINDALGMLWIPDRISVLATTGQTAYTLSLSTYPWLSESDRIIRLLDPAAANSNPRESTQSWSVRMDAENTVLEVSSGYTTGETFYIDVMRPAWSRLKKSGAWQDCTEATGVLTADTDEAVPPSKVIAHIAAVRVLQSLIRRGPTEYVVGYQQQLKELAPRAARIKAQYVEQVTDEVQPMRFSSYGGAGALSGGTITSGSWGG